ncbi:uncharacterized protein E5676_scaffold1071G00030 [Cucumis melo var. makuwa]|uniref:Uncharacterized protein n=1 Tax=Cucumis melo var. makuwa TaxID=1194695 RepID=A0A5D3C9D8_CUCMM|nr:uncharacterized protein E5676_scaffold1071G00030 [Cucumis melo var. makuwa]
MIHDRVDCRRRASVASTRAISRTSNHPSSRAVVERQPQASEPIHRKLLRVAVALCCFRQLPLRASRLAQPRPSIETERRPLEPSIVCRSCEAEPRCQPARTCVRSLRVEARPASRARFTPQAAPPHSTAASRASAPHHQPHLRHILNRKPSWEFVQTESDLDLGPSVLGVPLGISKDQHVPTGTQIARARGHASSGVEVEVRARASWRATKRKMPSRRGARRGGGRGGRGAGRGQPEEQPTVQAANPDAPVTQADLAAMKQ